MECLKHTDHRLYPPPETHPTWRQSWLDLAFFHWRVPAELVQSHLPEGLILDLYDGEAWISIASFRMEDVMLRGLPAIKGVSDFPELNLRTYVIKDGKPGVWFYSLDADQSFAVWAAKKFFHLPYFKADMNCLHLGESVTYLSKRECDGMRFEARYAPNGEIYHTQLGSLEYWLTERYCLYAMDDEAQLYRGEIHHQQWPLQKVEYAIMQNDLGLNDGFGLLPTPDLAQFSKKLEVVIWGLDPC